MFLCILFYENRENKFVSLILIIMTSSLRPNPFMPHFTCGHKTPLHTSLSESTVSLKTPEGTSLSFLSHPHTVIERVQNILVVCSGATLHPHESQLGKDIKMLVGP